MLPGTSFKVGSWSSSRYMNGLCSAHGGAFSQMWRQALHIPYLLDRLSLEQALENIGLDYALKGMKS